MSFFRQAKKNKIILPALLCAWLYIFPNLYQYIFVNNDNPLKVIHRIENNIGAQENRFNSILENQHLLNAFASNTYSLQDLEKYDHLDFTFQVYRVTGDSLPQLSFWNNNAVLPSNNELFFTDGKYAVKKDNGLFEYIKKTVQTPGSKLLVTALVPIRWEYFIETDYLKKQFAASKDIERKYTVSEIPTIYSVKNAEGTVLLYLKKTTELRNTNFSLVYIFCRILSLLILVWLLYVSCSWLAVNQSFYKGLGLLFTGLLLLRLLAYYFKFPVAYDTIEYFDPRIYAANAIQKSLGDLSFNLLFSFLLILFWLKHKHTKPTLFHRYGFYGDAIKMLLYTVSTYYVVWLFRSLIASSKISFNVTNILGMNSYSIFGFLHLAFIIILYYLFTSKVLRLKEIFFRNSFFKYLFIGAFGLMILFMNFSWANDRICLLVLVWMLGYAWACPYLENVPAIGYFNLSIRWLLFFSLSACILFGYENSIKEMEQRKFFARKLAFQSDPSTESLLSIALSRFDNNFLLSNSRKFYDKDLAYAFKDSLLFENFVGYLNKFETRIYTFDSLENPLYNRDSTGFQTFNAIVQNQGSRIPNVNGLYYYEIDFDLFRYIFKKNILDTAGKTIGYFIVQANPLTYKNKSAALSPELFKQRTPNLDENGNNYIFAVYSQFELRKRFVDYDLPTTIAPSDIPRGEDTIKYRNGYEELWWKLNKDSVVVIGKKTNIWIATITLFAYIFLSVFFTVFLLNFLELLFSGKLNKTYLKNILQLNFSKQVQGLIWLVSLLTFVIVGIVIISLFKTRFNKSNKERLSRTMSILIADVQNKLHDNAIFDDVVKVYEPGANEALKETIFQMSEIHNVDFNIYDLEGTLKLSSQPFIESKGILSDKIDPTAFFYLKRNASAQFMQQEKISSFSYLSMYVPIRDDKGKAYGYLNIPYYSSEKDLNLEISNFLITIINLNAFIFLIAGLIAWLVTSRITKSFVIIGDKMKAVSLGKNEIIQWNKNDEIGDLVKEYNKMVLKLEESVVVLAKSEREGAWREMARQVAHEIKNPLTPMKLSIQYLQKSIDIGSENVKELTTKVSQTLVEQIDHLSSIASDFSQFANIHISKTEQLHILPVLQSLQLLFSNENNTGISISNHAGDVCIMADKTQINRLFTNLIKNAVQAYEPSENKKLVITLSIKESELEISFRDFGSGIPEQLQEKIFTPNFTTKTSGTGLGLAISKGIAEQHGGRIVFHTEENKGTTFIVTLPLL
jgi:signal transduction histidine kinase